MFFELEIFVEFRSDKDEFLVLVCDGIWDVMSNDEFCDFVRSRMRVIDSLEMICNMVVDICFYKVGFYFVWCKFMLLNGLIVYEMYLLVFIIFFFDYL